jgi:hypothetical protein
VKTWVIELKGPDWSRSLRCARAFGTPEAAATYAHALVAEPDIWSEGEGWALCRLLESEDPEAVQVRITLLV